jgi:hypothetical protein
MADRYLYVNHRSFSERFQHRRSIFKELKYIFNGDNNDVIYYAGTSFGKHQWMNPVLAKVRRGACRCFRPATYYGEYPK